MTPLGPDCRSRMQALRRQVFNFTDYGGPNYMIDTVDTQEARAHLMQTSEEFRTLAAQHSDYERRIEELASRRFPTPEEQEEEARLKKMKLHLKDQMAHLVEQHSPAVH